VLQESSVTELATGDRADGGTVGQPGLIATAAGRGNGDELTRIDGDRSPCRTCI